MEEAMKARDASKQKEMMDHAADAPAVVDIEKIMQEIRDQIAAEGPKEKVPGFDEIPIRIETAPVATEFEDWTQFMDSLRYINENYDIPYYWELGGGGIKLFCKRIVRKLAKFLLAPIVARQNQMNACVVRCLNNIRYYIEGDCAHSQQLCNELEALKQAQNIYKERMQAQLNTVMLRIAQLQEEGDSQQAQLRLEYQQITEIFERRLAEQQTLLETHGSHFGVQKAEFKETVHQVAGEVAALQRRVNTLDHQSDAMSSSVAKALLKYKGSAAAQAHELQQDVFEKEEVIEVQGNTAYEKLDYFKFQNTFRGTRSLIAERLEMYLPYFTGQTKPILDIGCGRGEFLHLMQRNGISAFGVDLYPEYAVEGELQGLDVRQGDGMEYLAQSNETYGGIFLGQVIEHLSFNQLINLCFNAYQRLEPGAVLAMETPNPTSLSTFTSSFYIDPTHNKPIHPLMLEYVLREAGFTDVQTIYTNCSRPEQLPLIESGSIDNLSQVNEAIQRVSNMLYGSQDYAVIARKK